jgi:hypothetical protein
VSREPEVEQLLAPLADYEPEPRRLPIDREKIVSRMVDVSLAPGARFSSRARWFAGLALAAGFALAAFTGLHYFRGEAPQAGLFGVEVQVLRGRVTPLGSEGTLETSAGAEARIKALGMEFELLENSKVSLKELGAPGRGSSAVRLDRGRVRCVIPHRPDRTFTVVTADARVVDIGTIFSVTVQPSPSGPKTLVEVEEGEVLVHYAGGQRRIAAAQSFSTAAVVTAAAPAPAVLAPVAEEASRPAPRRDAPVPKRPRETLGVETQLLRDGLAREQKGDLRAARAAFETLVARYPESPLAPDARAALARVKGRLESSR